MARRGEGQYVAVEVGLRHDPKVLGLARRLKIHKLHAVGLVSSWREMVLVRGTGAGAVKGYSRQELCEYLDWPKGPAPLIDALKMAGMLRTKRGCFVYPFWHDTITGSFAQHRSSDRDRKLDERATRKRWTAVYPGGAWPGFEEAKERLRGHSGEVPGNVQGTSADAPEESGHKETKGPPGPPVPGGVGGVADARNGLTEWFLELYPRLKNEGKCRKVLGRMTTAQAEQLRYCLPLQLRRYMAAMTGRGGRGVPFADKYLEGEWYLELRPPKPKASNGHKNGHATKAEEQQEKTALVEREEVHWRRRDVIRARLHAQGVHLRGVELHQRIDQEIEREDQEQGGLPS
jgi:hypothetical protein